MQEKRIEQAYRASIAAIIVDADDNFLFVQLAKAEQEQWDFVKGGMLVGEDELDTLERELVEELGSDFHYEILRRSEWSLVYEWSADLRERKGYRGQARVSYWVRALEGGAISIQEEELSASKWVPASELRACMLSSGFSEWEYETFELDFQRLKKESA